MRCAACHAEIAKAGRFCPECAAPLAPGTVKRGILGKPGRHVAIAAGVLTLAVWLSAPGVRNSWNLAQAAYGQVPGRSIGKISTQGDLIVLTLDEGVLGKANMFDLVKRTLRFTPDGSGYRVENLALQWDPEFGAQFTEPQVALHNFAFPFSGQSWNSLSVGQNGTIAFAPQQTQGGRGGVAIGRFDQLQIAARDLVNTVPAICVFLKRMSGPRYVKELGDRVVITWNLTEPWADIQDFNWVPTTNRFQVVLRRDGSIEMSYDQLSAKDGIVGLYPTVRTNGQPRPAEIDLSALTKQDGPFAVVYEAFHYLSLPNMQDTACTVIGALGDKFDFLAYYSDFRVDNQEAGTPSNGPRGGGPSHVAVTGIGASQWRPDFFCSAGRFQWEFIQPVYSGSNQVQERPPDGVAVRSAGSTNMSGYNLAMTQIAHEMGHRWGAFVSARVKGEIIPLGPTHWATGLQTQVAFPYKRITEGSIMGGGAWQDNFDGTFTQLDDEFDVPATGWSPLDLYLMGLAGPSEVPDFFILRNLVAAGKDPNGHPIFKADRVKVTIEDVIAAEGPRLPTVEQSQKKFNTGIVVMVEHGATPSRELIERANGIREKWMEYWSITSGGRSSMTTSPR